MQPHIIKHQRVQMTDAAVSAGAPSTGAAHKSAGRKHVRLIEHEGVVRALEVICSCGETTRIELAFGPTATPVKPAQNGSTKGQS